MINSGKAPKFPGGSNTALMSNPAFTPVTNIHTEGGSQNNALAERIAGQVCNAITNATPDRFRNSNSETMAHLASSLRRASSKNA
jgi:hypothetical protein